MPWPGDGVSSQLLAPRVLHLMVPLVLLSTEIKNTRRKSSEFQFDSETLLRTIAQDTVSHIALRNCSKELKREVSIYMTLDKGICNPVRIMEKVMRNRFLS